MASPAPTPTIVLAAVEDLGPPGTPVTTPEVAAEFDCTDRTIYNRLDALAEDDVLETKKVGAKGRVWWRPVREHGHDGEDEPDGTDEPDGILDADAAESTFRQLFENVPGLYLIVEPDDYGIVAVSDAYLAATMTEREAIVGKTLFEVFPADPDDPDPEGVPRLRASLERVKTEREADVMPVTYYPIPRPESEGGGFEERWWSPTNSPVFDAAGEIDYIVHRVEDVTPVVRQFQADGEEDLFDGLDADDSHLAADVILRGDELQRAKERAYDRLRESELRWRKLVDASSYVIYRMNADWSEMRELRGGFVAETAEPSEDWIDEYIPPDEQRRVREAIDEAIETGSAFELEHQVLQDDGTRGWTHSRAVPILDDDGEVTEWFGAATDITERMETQEALRESEARYRTLFENVPVGVYVCDSDAVIRNYNRRAADIWGREPTTGDPDERYCGSQRVYYPDGTPMPPEESPMAAVLADGHPVHNVEATVERPDGSRAPVVVNFTPLTDTREEVSGVIATFDDIGERKQQERLLEEQKELLERIATGAPLAECLTALCTAVPRLSSGVRASVMLADDERESFRRPVAPNLSESWGDGLEDAPIDDPVIGTCGEAVSRGDPVTCEDVATDDGRSSEWRELCVANGVLAGHSEPILDTDGEPVGSLMLCFDEPRRPTEWEHRVADFATYIAGIAVERHQSRRALRRINESLERLTAASRELMDADTREIRDHVAELARDVLDVEYAELWHYDERVGEIEAYAGRSAAETDARAFRLPAELSERVWRTFVGDEVDVENDLDAPGSGSSEPSLRSRVLVPLGRHGVVCAGSSRPGRFDERTVDLAETVAATVETAWDRAEGERELARRNDELTRLDRLNTLIRGIDQALVEAETVDAIDGAVCERLADSALYEFAWIGEFDADADAVEPRAWAGVTSSYLDDITTAMDDSAAGESPFVAAVRTGELQVVADVATDARAAPWRETTLERGARSCLSIPLAYGTGVFGVLTVYGRSPQHDERDTDVLAELGQTIAHAMHAVETRTTLRADSVIELTIRSTSVETPLCRLARDTGCVLEFEGLVPGADGEETIFFTATGIAPDELVAAGEESVGIEELRCLTEREDGARFRARLAGPALAALFLDRDARVRSLTVDGGTATGVVDLPETVDVREFVEGIRRLVPDVELLSRRSRIRSLDTRHALQSGVPERLTARQREVLQTAYRSGFFESPRVQSGRDLAAALDISQSTFSHHIREAERRLCELAFGDA